MTKMRRLAVTALASLVIEWASRWRKPPGFASAGSFLPACQLHSLPHLKPKKSRENYRSGFAMPRPAALRALRCPGALLRPFNGGQTHHGVRRGFMIVTMALGEQNTLIAVPSALA